MPPFSLRMGRPDSSVCVTHQGWGSPSTVVQPFQVTPWKMKGKLHSEPGSGDSGPDVVKQIEGSGDAVAVGGSEMEQANHN